MAKIKLILLSLLLATALGTITSASASAHEYLVEGTPVGAGVKLEVEGTTSLVWIETSILKAPIVQECDEGTGTGFIEEKGKSTGKGEAKNCRIFQIVKGKRENLTACAMREPVVIETTGELTGIGENTAVGSKAEEGFTEFEIKGESCVLAGKYTIKGQELCLSPLAEMEKVLHEVICTAAGSKLKLGKEPVRLYGIKAGLGKLKSGKPSSSN